MCGKEKHKNMNKKSLALVFAAAVLGLTACGGEGGGTSANSGKSNAPTSSKAPASSKLPSSSRPPVKAASFDEVSFTTKENKVYLVLTGSASNLEAADIKATVGLMEVGSGSAERTDDEGNVIPAVPATWILGKETPADADYNLTPTLENKALKLEVCLSDITGLKAGQYTIYAGIKTYMDYAAFSTDLAEATGGKDSAFRYYTRNSVTSANGLALCIEALPPLSLDEAKAVYENEKVYVMWGGEASKTLDELKAYNSYVDFQRMGQYSVARFSQMIDEPVAGTNYYEYVQEGNKIFVKCDVTSVFQAGERWMTHYNCTGSSAANCFMNGNLDQTYTLEAANLKIKVYSNPAAGQGGGEAEYYGCLGFEIEAINAEA